MLFALMIYAEPGHAESIPATEAEEAHADYLALAGDDRVVAAVRLMGVETATSVRVIEGRTLVSDGPFADTKEVLGGLCVVEAATLDEALALAARIPAARFGGTVEVRPVMRP